MSWTWRPLEQTSRLKWHSEWNLFCEVWSTLNWYWYWFTRNLGNIDVNSLSPPPGGTYLVNIGSTLGQNWVNIGSTLNQHWIKIGVTRKLEVAVCLLTTKTDMAVSKEEYCASSHWRPVENNTHTYIFSSIVEVFIAIKDQLPIAIEYQELHPCSVMNQYFPDDNDFSDSLMIMIHHIHLIGFRSRTTQMGLPQPSLFHPGSSESFFHSWKKSILIQRK